MVKKLGTHTYPCSSPPPKHNYFEAYQMLMSTKFRKFMELYRPAHSLSKANFKSTIYKKNWNLRKQYCMILMTDFQWWNMYVLLDHNHCPSLCLSWAPSQTPLLLHPSSLEFKVDLINCMVVSSFTSSISPPWFQQYSLADVQYFSSLINA